MKVDVQYRPAYALALVTLDKNEQIQVEGGAMVGMSADMEMETEASGGLLKSLSRKMFGGYGIFESAAMFALVDSQGQVFLKVDDSNRERFESAGAEKHGRMPYYQVSGDVLGDAEQLRDWARPSIQIAHAPKKK